MRSVPITIALLLCSFPLGQAETHSQDVVIGRVWITPPTAALDPGGPSVAVDDFSVGAESRDDKVQAEARTSGAHAEVEPAPEPSPDLPPTCADTIEDEVCFVDRNEPTNDACAGAEPWPVHTLGHSGSSAGQTAEEDVDWSSIFLHKTERIFVGGSNAAIGASRPDCLGAELTFLVTTEGFHFIHSRYDLVEGSYTVTYDVKQNDGLEQGQLPSETPRGDAGSTPADAFTILVPSGDVPLTVEGALPYRGRINDIDTYRMKIPAPLLHDPTKTTLPSAVVTVGITTPCGASAPILIQLGFGQPAETCGGETRHSCIAVGSEAYLKLWTEVNDVAEKVGTSYELKVTASVPYFFNLDYTKAEGRLAATTAALLDQDARAAFSSATSLVETGRMDERTPWCDPLAPLIVTATLEAWNGAGAVAHELLPGEEGVQGIPIRLLAAYLP